MGMGVFQSRKYFYISVLQLTTGFDAGIRTPTLLCAPSRADTVGSHIPPDLEISGNWLRCWDSNPHFTLRAVARRYRGFAYPTRSRDFRELAERVGFEPTVRFPAHTRSRRAP
jgi:hypothetical protein